MTDAAPSRIVCLVTQDIENDAQGEMFVNPEEIEKRISDVKLCIACDPYKNCGSIGMLLPLLGNTLQIVAALSVNSLHVARESASRRHLENRGLQKEEMQYIMDHLTFLSTVPENNAIQWWLGYIISFLFLYDKLTGVLYGTGMGNPDSFEPTFSGETLGATFNILLTRSLHDLMGKHRVCVPGQFEWYRLWTCMLVHQDWKQLSWGFFLLYYHPCVSLQQRLGLERFLRLFLLASFGAALYHFVQVPQEERIGAECIIYLFVGMEHADMFVNYDLLIIFVELKWGSLFPYWFLVLGTGGLIVLGSFAYFFFTNASVVLSYLVYGFCVSLPFIPRLDESHPGFLGNRSTKWWMRFSGATKVVCFFFAMTSMIIFIGSILNGKYC